MSFALCESDTVLNRRLEISIRALRSRRSLGTELTRDVIVRGRGREGERERERERCPVRQDSGRDEDAAREGRRVSERLILHSAWVNLENVLPGLLLWK